jgi:hypothetical protein
MAAALEKVAGQQAAALLDWQPGCRDREAVRSWPGDVAWERARGLGLRNDEASRRSCASTSPRTRRPCASRALRIAMPRFAANLSMLYPEHAFLDRFEAAARDGFQAWNTCFPYEHEPGELALA